MASVCTFTNGFSDYQVDIQKQISILLFFFLLSVTFCNNPARAQSDLIFKKISVEAGLSHTTAHHIMQDRRGLIWISTRDGLNRYDGQNFKVFKHEPGNPNSLSANMVWLTYEDSNGLIWIGTSGGGLNVYDSDAEQFHRFLHDPDDKQTISGNTIISIFEDQQGTMWIGTDSGGLNKVVNQQWESDELKLQFKHYLPDSSNAQSITDATVMDIAQRNSRYLWIATYGGGVNRFDIENETFSSDHEIGGFFVMSLAIKGNELWAGTKYNGLSLLNLDDNSLRVFRHDPGNPNSINSDFVWPVYIDDDGVVWAGTFGDGLNKITPLKKEGSPGFSISSYKAGTSVPAPLPGNSILSIFQDRNDVMWIATDNNGISLFRKEIRFQKPDIYIQDSNVSVKDLKFKAFLQEDDGNRWIGTASGLLYQPAGSKEVRFVDPDGASKVINVLQKLQDGSILVGTNLGLYKLQKDAVKLVKLSLKLSFGVATVDRVYDIVQSSDGTIWLSTNTGLWKLNADIEVVNRFYHQEGSESSLGSTHIGNLYLEEDTLWVGSSMAGLNKLNINTGKVKQFQQNIREPGTIGSNKVLDMYRDSGGRFWITTFGGGLNELVYKDGEPTFRRYLEEDGLPDNTVKHLAEDSTGKLWVTTQKGLARLTPAGRKIVPISVPIEDSNLNLNNIIPVGNGEFIITSAKGYRVFDPADFLQQKKGAPLLLTKIEVNDKSYPIDNRYNPNELELPYEENFLSFEFSLLEYFSSDFASYYYMLEGIDRGWVRATNQNRANYSALPPGDYTFRVKATSYDGTPAENELALEVSILPPFWETWWFKLGVLALAIGILWGFYRYRINALLKVERTRRGIASDLHDDISTTLSSITYFARALRMNYPQLTGSRNLNLILDSTTDAKEKISDIVWSIDPEHDGWMNLLSRCRRYASDLFESKNIDYELDIVEKIDTEITVELRKELWLIFKEMVTNVVRHSQAGEAKIIIRYEKGILKLIVNDDGVGMEERCFSNGNGLGNIKRRASTIGADLSLDTSAEDGTTWEMTLKL